MKSTQIAEYSSLLFSCYVIFLISPSVCGEGGKSLETHAASQTERYTSSSSKTLDPSLFRPPWEESKGWNDRGSSRSRRSFYSSVVELERAERNDGDIERRVTAGGLAVSPNDVGRISKRSRINVMTPPRVKAVTNLTAVAGRPFTLSCPYSGYPVNEVYFLRDNRKLPFDKRHAVSSLGSVHFNSISKEDAGAYQCIIVSLNGERSEGTIILRVAAPIVMSPFVFPDNLEEGMRASVVCSVVSGDPPISIKWFKDGQDIEKSLDSIQIVSITEFVSSLIVNRLDRSFTGNYTCRATSEAGSVNHTAKLFVRAKPLWILKPTSQTVVAGSSARLDCLADGYPEPVIRWKMQRKLDPYFTSSLSHDSTYSSSLASSSSSSSSSLSVTSVTILSSPRIHVLENGSLIIKSVEVEDQGKYVCEASNGVEKSVETSADLLVFEAPKVRPSSAQLTIKRRDRAEVSCRAVGSPLLSFKWLKNDHPLTDSHSPPHFSIHEEESSNRREKVTLLTIHSVSRNDSGVFSCLVTNDYGSDKGSIKVIVQEPPEAPTDLRILEISSRYVSISWSTAFNGNSPITGYEVVHRAAHENWIEGKTMFISSSPGSSNSVVVRNLSPLTAYTIRMRAENELGKSEYSREITVTTTIEAPQFVPQNISCVPLDSKSIRVSWIVPPLQKNTIVEGFYIGYKVYASGEAFTFKTMHIILNSGKDLTPVSLSPQARQSMLASTISISSLVPTTSLSSSMSAFSASSSSSTTLRKFEYTIDLLRKSTKYVIIVQAFNSKGAGPSSPEVTVETYANDPPKPPSLRIEGISANSVTASWRVEGDSMSPPPLSSSLQSSSSAVSSSSLNAFEESLAGFILSYRRNEEASIDEWETVRLSRHQRKYVLSNLLCGNKYIIKISAFNEVGSSDASDEIHFSTEGRPPVAPDKYSFIRSNITSVALNLKSWKDGGCPISHFVVQFKPKNQPEWVLLSNHILPEQESITIRELQTSTWHDLLVLVKNEAGTTEANFVFATLTPTGGTIAPMLLSDHGLSRNPFDAVMILVPTVCAILVLILVGGVALYMLLCKKRLLDIDVHSDHYSRHPNDTLSLNSFSKTPSKGSVLGSGNACGLSVGTGVGGGEPIYEHQRVQVYYPSVYCTSTGSGIGGADHGAQMMRTANVASFLHDPNGLTTATTAEYGFTTMDSGRVLTTAATMGLRKGERNHTHVYDVPHRFDRKDPNSCISTLSTLRPPSFRSLYEHQQQLQHQQQHELEGEVEEGIIVGADEETEQRQNDSHSLIV